MVSFSSKHYYQEGKDSNSSPSPFPSVSPNSPTKSTGIPEQNKTGRKPLFLLAPVQEKVFLKMTSTHKQQHPQDEFRRALSLHTPCLVPMGAPLINTLCHHSLPNNSALKLSQKPNMSASERAESTITLLILTDNTASECFTEALFPACRELTIDTRESSVLLPTSVF